MGRVHLAKNEERGTVFAEKCYLAGLVVETLGCSFLLLEWLSANGTLGFRVLLQIEGDVDVLEGSHEMTLGI